MHQFKRIAATVAAATLAGVGIAAGSSGTAFAAAAADPPVTGCYLATGASCTAGPSRVINPISFRFTAAKALVDLGNVTVTAYMGCAVNGGTVHFSITRILTSASRSKTWSGLQSRAGSPVPNSCDVTLEAAQPTVLAVAPAAGPANPPNVILTAVTAVGGAIYQNSGTTGGGAEAKLCADARNNGNAGTIIQGWSCLSDLAQFWVHTNAGQFVRNGDCMTAGNGGEVVLERCRVNLAGNPILSQRWTKYGPSNTPSRVYNGIGNRCLTAPSVSNGVPLRVRACTGAANQLWAVPPKSPAP